MTCEAPAVYWIAELFLIGVALVVAFFAGAAIVWWRMTGQRGVSC